MPVDLNRRQSIEEITNGRIKKVAGTEVTERPKARGEQTERPRSRRGTAETRK